MNGYVKQTFFYGEGDQQFAHLYMPQLRPTKKPVVVVIHGGYWKDNHSLDTYATSAIVEHLKTQQVAIWNLEYRRMDAVGENKKAPWPATFIDVANGIDYLRVISDEFALDMDRVFIVGHSAGGHLAVWASMRKRIPTTSELFCANPLPILRTLSISAILNLSAFDDVDQPNQIKRLIGGDTVTQTERFDACDPSRLNEPTTQLTIIHGEKDECISSAQAKNFARNAKCKPSLILLPGADHFSMLPHEGHWQKTQWHIVTTQINALITS